MSVTEKVCARLGVLKVALKVCTPLSPLPPEVNVYVVTVVEFVALAKVAARSLLVSLTVPVYPVARLPKASSP